MAEQARLRAAFGGAVVAAVFLFALGIIYSLAGKFPEADKWLKGDFYVEDAIHLGVALLMLLVVARVLPTVKALAGLALARSLNLSRRPDRDHLRPSVYQLGRGIGMAVCSGIAWGIVADPLGIVIDVSDLGWLRPVIYLVLAFLIVVGLYLCYLGARPFLPGFLRPAEIEACPMCGAGYRKGDKFCSSCGADLTPAEPPMEAGGACPQCGTPYTGAIKFCTNCGTKLGE